MKIKFLFILLAVFLAPKMYSQDSNFHIYICFGQSNMEGKGTIEEQDKVVDSRFIVTKALDHLNNGETKALWNTAVPPLCLTSSGLSPVDYFGRTMVANLPDSITVGVINVAVGGCDIRLFDKDIYQDYDYKENKEWFSKKVAEYGGNPYQYLIDLAKAAQQDGVIKGILLHQGETNTGQTEWLSFVIKVYNNMLTDLSLDMDSTPLLVGELLSAEGNCCSSMNSIINMLPDTITTAHIISSEGCTAMDRAHFDSEGYRKFGRRYAKQMLSLMGYDVVNE